MQTNVFEKAIPLLKDREVNIDADTFVEFLAQYNSEDWIYPATLCKIAKCNIKDAYEALEILRETGYVEQYLEIYCPNCERFTKQHYKTIGEVPEEVSCSNCREEINNPLEHAFVIYKRL